MYVYVHIYLHTVMKIVYFPIHTLSQLLEKINKIKLVRESDTDLTDISVYLRVSIN